jgi:catechol 2,3-dioxygenase-like lactoylglutathione lyase family enzyme
MRLLRSLAALALAMFAAPAQAQGGGEVSAASDSPVIGIQQVTMTVRDIDATIAFYRQAVPVTLVRRFRLPGSRFPAALLSKSAKSVDVAIIALPTGHIQLLDFAPGRDAAPNPLPVIGPGYSHICFQSPASDPAILKFKAAGLDIISRFGRPDGVDIGGYGVRYAYGRDPNGIMIENETLDKPRRAEAAWMTHIANVVHDRDAMLAFYQRLTGRKPHRTLESANNPRLDDVAAIDGLSIRGGWINLGNMELEVWEYVRPRTPAPVGRRKLDQIGYAYVALEVADIARETARLRRDKMVLIGGRRDIGGWLTQFALDPEGNIVALVQRAVAPARESVTALR